MAYETGTATGPSDLATKLSTFLTTNGWTEDDTASSSPTLEVLLNDGGSFYVSLICTASSLRIIPNTGYSGVAASDEQPGSAFDNNGWTADRGLVQNFAGPYTAYHFFLDQSADVPDGDQLIVVVEQDTELYRMFAFGTLKKFGTYDGGQFVSHDNHDTISGTDQFGNTSGLFGNDVSSGNTDQGIVRVGGLDSLSEDWMGQESVTGHSGASGRRMAWSAPSGNESGFGGEIFPLTLKASYSTFWPLFPIHCMVSRDLDDSSPTSISFAGSVPMCFGINTRDFDPGQVLTIGSDDYLVFPKGRKSNDFDDATMPNVFREGLAINRDV